VLVGFWLFHPFLTRRQIGAGDALWYANMLADFVTQWRSGVFPVFVGQTEFAFNGAVYPLRVAPLYQHLAGVIDLFTGRQLGFFALQHATVIVCGFAGLFISYLTLIRLAPQQRWSACALAILYISCPGVLGTIYTQDLYMTWMTVPFLPLACYATVRTFQSDGWPAQFLLAASLAALWWGHSPVALWTTLLVGVMQLVRLSSIHRRLDSWKKATGGAALFALLGHYPFVSVALLQSPGATSVVTSGLAQEERITNVIREVFPAILLPVSDHARALSDLQLGYGLGLLLLLATAAAFRARNRILWCLVACSALLLLLLLPVPFVNAWLWTNLPEQIKRITFYWPMHRFYLLLAALIVSASSLALAHWFNRNKTVGKVLGFLLCAAVCWNLAESRQFVAAGQERTASADQSLKAMRPENRLLMNHSYGLFPSLPAYFSNGVMDPGAEVRLLAPGTLQPILTPASESLFDGEFRGSADNNPGVLKLTPTLQVKPGHRYALDFEFGNHRYAGVLQLTGRTFFREYILPQSGQPQAFGTQPSNAKSLSLWTSASETEVITLRYIPTDGTSPSAYSSFARYRLREIDANTRPATVASLLPFRAIVHTDTTAWLETPRMFIPGYAAAADGQPTEVQRSPQGLVMLEVTRSTRAVEVRYTGPVVLRLAYWLSLAAWSVLLIVASFCLLRNLFVPAPPPAVVS
jgi:hypothetical protein